MQRLEQAIQRAIFQHLKIRAAPGVFGFHVPNGAYLGGKRSAKGIAIQGSILKGVGLVKGVPDVVLVKRLEWKGSPQASATFGQFFALEIKKSKKDLPSEDQWKVIHQLEACGAICGVAYSLDEAIAWLEGHGLLKGRAG